MRDFVILRGNEEEGPTVDREVAASVEPRPMGLKQLDSLCVPISRSVRPLGGTNWQPSLEGFAASQSIRLCQVDDLKVKYSQSQHFSNTIF